MIRGRNRISRRDQLKLQKRRKPFAVSTVSGRESYGKELSHGYQILEQDLFHSVTLRTLHRDPTLKKKV